MQRKNLTKFNTICNIKIIRKLEYKGNISIRLKYLKNTEVNIRHICKRLNTHCLTIPRQKDIHSLLCYSHSNESTSQHYKARK